MCSYCQQSALQILTFAFWIKSLQELLLLTGRERVSPKELGATMADCRWLQKLPIEEQSARKIQSSQIRWSIVSRELHYTLPTHWAQVSGQWTRMPWWQCSWPIRMYKPCVGCHLGAMGNLHCISSILQNSWPWSKFESPSKLVGTERNTLVGWDIRWKSCWLTIDIQVIQMYKKMWYLNQISFLIIS